MTKKIIVFLTFVVILALMTTMFTTIVKPVKAAEQITILNHQGILESTGYFDVVGEVKNTGDTAAQNVNVKITFTSDEGDDVDRNGCTYPHNTTGKKSPIHGHSSGSRITSNII